MVDTVIRAENLGKKYIINHEKQERYVALRDILAKKASHLKHKLLRSNTGTYSNREDFWALNDLSFEIKQGERIGIIGRNGAGKSTLLKILSRITDPTTGFVELQGRVASLLEVGTGFHPELTGKENIYLNGAILGMSKSEIRRKFDQIVDFAEVESFLDVPVKRYSSGMYVRLAFAVAAHIEPEILIIDEVLAVGDADFQRKCLGKMKEAGREGRTVIFVSHNMPTIQALCQRVMWLQKGTIRDIGVPTEIISHYLADGLTQESSESNLEKHSGRSRSQEPALKRVFTFNSEGQKTNSILMGKSLYIHVEFDCSRKILNPGFGIGVEDECGRRIFSLNNYMTGLFKKSAQSGSFRFSIPRVTLLPGNYLISLALVENQTVWIDSIDQAISFSIEPADVFGTGKIPEANQGIVYIEHSELSIMETIQDEKNNL